MEKVERLRVVIRGAVQGVGFRPFVYKLANALDLSGWVINSSQGLFIEVEGATTRLAEFLRRVASEKPVHAFIQSMESSWLDPEGFESFEIRKSEDTGEKTVLVLPDIATCPECLREIFDPADRRYRYPFTNCTLCGPRFTIVESLPYDRPGTSMKHFPMCADCLREYEDPNDRRFHAQPNACPACGPLVYACQPDGTVIADDHVAIQLIAKRLAAGRIAAVKGLGGFHLCADAGNGVAVRELRIRKRRNEKPFAVMMPSLSAVKSICDVDTTEERLLRSSEAPIVLLRRKTASDTSVTPETLMIAEPVAPGNPNLGVMLPYTPLHHLLMEAIGRPIVATSGNLSDEPICIDEAEALERLGGIADVFLMHNRPIVRHVDDAIVRVMAGREMVLRRARGYAPLPVQTREKKRPALAVGAHQKNAVAVRIGDNVMVSQHIGDLETAQSFAAFERSIESLKQLYAVRPESIIRDMHPDYLSSKYADEQGLPVNKIQHHHAHVASCMAENRLTGPVFGVAWDGTGAGTDGTVWGGEFFLGDERRMKRIGSFRKFRLAGSSQAVKEPRRSALGVLHDIFGPEIPATIPAVRAFEPAERAILEKALATGFNAPRTSSVGRLCDAVASLIGLRQIASFDGQAAMELEFAADSVSERAASMETVYPFTAAPEIDWEPMVRAIVEDHENGVEPGVISLRFHDTLAEIIVGMARFAGEKRVVLSGGCFQNRYLTERAIKRLRAEGFAPYWHQRIPPNDGGIALGQLYAAGDVVGSGS